jgi:hypothetical protein
MQPLTLTLTPRNPASESLGQEADLSLRLQTIDPALDLEDEVGRLKSEMHAVILAHYYQDGDIQDLADHVGDSLALAQAAAKTDADVMSSAASTSWPRPPRSSTRTSWSCCPTSTPAARSPTAVPPTCTRSG